MKKTMSLKQLAANRRNALQSTGPKTANGKAVSKMNALRHGILSTQVLVRGRVGRESADEFTTLHQRFTEELRPVGPLEEMLVDQIVTAHWRLRRALTAEAGEIAVSVDEGEWKRRPERNSDLLRLQWGLGMDPVQGMQESWYGNIAIVFGLRNVQQAVERDGELTEAAVQEMTKACDGKLNSLTVKLEDLRVRLQQNPDGLDAAALRARSREQALKFVQQEWRNAQCRIVECEEREKLTEQARQAAAVLPSADTLDKILRYETKLERQLFRAMNQLERLQRMRQGEAVPAPLTMDVTGKEPE